MHDVENHLKQNNMAAIESMLPRVKKLNLDDEAVNKLASRWVASPRLLPRSPAATPDSRPWLPLSRSNRLFVPSSASLVEKLEAAVEEWRSVQARRASMPARLTNEPSGASHTAGGAGSIQASTGASTTRPPLVQEVDSGGDSDRDGDGGAVRAFSDGDTAVSVLSSRVAALSLDGHEGVVCLVCVPVRHALSVCNTVPPLPCPLRQRCAHKH